MTLATLHMVILAAVSIGIRLEHIQISHWWKRLPPKTLDVPGYGCLGNPLMYLLLDHQA